MVPFVSKVREDLRLDAQKLVDRLQQSEVLEIIAGSLETSFHVRLVRDHGDETPEAVGDDQNTLMRIWVQDGDVIVAPYWKRHQSVKKRFSDYLAKTHNSHLEQLHLKDIEPDKVVDLLEAAANDVL